MLKPAMRLAALLLFGSSLAVLSAAEPVDGFGIRQLHPTVAGGREWHAQWDAERVVRPYEMDPADPLFRNEAGELRLGRSVAHASAGLTRLVVGTVAPLPEWRNVEMTIYVMRGPRRKTLDYQAFYLSARSGWQHNDKVPCEGTSYHSTARFDGTFGFKKEIWHTGGYTKLRPVPAPKLWSTVPERQWIGLKFVCRNSAGDRHVHLQFYLDENNRNEWRLAAETTDAGGWQGEQEGCNRARDYIITEARPAVYFRTDEVAVDLRNFSVREIAPE